MNTEKESNLRVGVGGFGAIGRMVAKSVDDGIPGLVLAAVSARDLARARRRMEGFDTAVDIVPLGELAERCDIVVECASAAAFAEIAEPAIRAGRTLITLSASALLNHWELIEIARETHAHVILPTGALIGFDTVRAAAEGTIHSVILVTRKPPAGFADAPFLEQHGIALDGLSEPLKLFEGTAREGAAGFPANVNVAAALSLAGIGPDETRMEIWADPGISRNIHHVVVDADSARFEIKIESIPTDENPRTGRITPLSVISALKGLVAPLKIGT